MKAQRFIVKGIYTPLQLKYLQFQLMLSTTLGDNLCCLIIQLYCSWVHKLLESTSNDLAGDCLQR